MANYAGYHQPRHACCICSKRGVVFHREVVHGKHLWRDRGAKTWVFASDAFVEALEAQKFEGWCKDEHYDEV